MSESGNLTVAVAVEVGNHGIRDRFRHRPSPCPVDFQAPAPAQKFTPSIAVEVCRDNGTLRCFRKFNPPVCVAGNEITTDKCRFAARCLTRFRNFFAVDSNQSDLAGHILTDAFVESSITFR